MRDLVLCCDGTWNTPELETVTNVVKLYHTLENDSQQVCEYQSGVGTTGGPIGWLAGGATGAGISRDVMSAYYWLVTHYEPGDRVWLFGFSRGAYTARSVAGMISRCGIPSNIPDMIWPNIERLYEQVYRGRGPVPDDIRFAYDPEHPGGTDYPVYFIGVWDTVGALGIPEYFAVLNLFDPPTRYRFYSVALDARVKHARHALALDEPRAPFTPTLWDIDSPEDARRIKQVWFPGSHCDVGGGYADAGLAHGALRWMIEEAASVKPHGLRFRKELVDGITADARGTLHDDNRAALAFLGPVYTVIEPVLDVVFESRPRSVPALSESEVYSAERPHGKVHASVISRQKGRFIQAGEYRSHRSLKIDERISFSVQAHLEWNESGVYLEGGAEYEFRAQGRWRDMDFWSGPEGDEKSHLRRLPGTLLGKLEPAYQMLTKNRSANFVFTRRLEAAPWMALIGVVANGRIRSNADYQEHETFMIGSHLNYKVLESGYFYAFANDARGAYNDNLGGVELTIRRIA